MTDFIILLLRQVTLFSSVTALILIAVKLLFKCRIPPHIGMIMWIVLLLRLFCPLMPESRFSVYNLIPEGRDVMYTLTTEVTEELNERSAKIEEEENPYILIRYETKDADVLADVPQTYESDMNELKPTLNDIILTVYLAGVIVSLSGILLSFRAAKKRAMRRSYECTDETLLMTYRKAAVEMHITKLPPLRLGEHSMLAGIIHPYVICEEGLHVRDSEMVFAHELNHYKYRDNPILFFSSVIVCFFWYNPLLWIVRKMLREDVEVLCDSRTLSECGIRGTEYAMMLCRHSAFGELRRSVSDGLYMSASGRHLKTRLKTISNRKSAAKNRIMSALLCAILIAVCLTNPVISQNSDYAVYIENYSRLTGQDTRSMYLDASMTVSAYLNRISTLLSSAGADNLKSQIGNGNLERFKRVCAEDGKIPSEIVSRIRSFNSDEVLTNYSLSVIDYAVLLLFDAEIGTSSSLPEVISVNEMTQITSQLTDTEAAALLSCYNRGVKGAEVEYAEFYTEAMFDLIQSRFNDDWVGEKFCGFYQKLELNEVDTSDYSEELVDAIRGLKRSSSVYIRDPSITRVEETTLRRFIGAAFAGEDENTYYLKKYNDGIDKDTALFLLKRGGFTEEKRLEGYVEAGFIASVPKDKDISVSVVRDEKVSIIGAPGNEVRNAIETVWSYGLVGNPGKLFDMSETLSCGEGLKAAYILICSLR